MPVDDLAGGFVYPGNTPEQLLAGDEPIKTASAVAVGAKTKYQIAARTSAGVVDFTPGTHTALQAVLVMQPCASGSGCQYAYAGKFNDFLLATYNATLYANAAFDTWPEREAFFNGLFRLGRLGQGFAN